MLVSSSATDLPWPAMGPTEPFPIPPALPTHSRAVSDPGLPHLSSSWPQPVVWYPNMALAPWRCLMPGAVAWFQLIPTAYPASSAEVFVNDLLHAFCLVGLTQCWGLCGNEISRRVHGRTRSVGLKTSITSSFNHNCTQRDYTAVKMEINWATFEKNRAISNTAVDLLLLIFQALHWTDFSVYEFCFKYFSDTGKQAWPNPYIPAFSQF